MTSLLDLVGRPDGPLAGASLLHLVVSRTEDVTARMRRVVLEGEGVGALAYAPGQDLMLRVPVGEGEVTHRRYTIRHVDRGRAQVWVDFVRHGHGPAARWAERARPGDTIDAIGPRGAGVAADAGWHLFVGDESALPATYAMLEALPVGAIGGALLEVRDAGEEQELLTTAVADVSIRWIYRGSDAGATPGRLADALAATVLPAAAFEPGQGHLYLNGEAREVRRMRRDLLDRGVPAEAVSHKAYWVHGRPNAAHGEPGRDPEEAGHR